jgi:phospholipid-translocating ATPase
MITGDKIETAECISRSCGLQNVTETNIKIEEAVNGQLWKVKWDKVKQNLNRVLIIDGKTLAYVLEDKDRSKDFFVHAMKMPSVICCRCSPQQKRTLTEGVKNNKPKN